MGNLSSVTRITEELSSNLNNVLQENFENLLTGQENFVRILPKIFRRICRLLSREIADL